MDHEGGPLGVDEGPGLAGGRSLREEAPAGASLGEYEPAGAGSYGSRLNGAIPPLAELHIPCGECVRSPICPTEQIRDAGSSP